MNRSMWRKAKAEVQRRVNRPRARRLVRGLVTTAFALGVPAIACASEGASVPGYTLTSGRAVAMTAMALALGGAIVGGLARARAAARVGNGGRRGAVVAVVLAPLGLLIGGYVIATANGGPGSGSGIVGGFVAVLLGLVGTALGGSALGRSRGTA